MKLPFFIALCSILGAELFVYGTMKLSVVQLLWKYARGGLTISSTISVSDSIDTETNNLILIATSTSTNSKRRMRRKDKRRMRRKEVTSIIENHHEDDDTNDGLNITTTTSHHHRRKQDQRNVAMLHQFETQEDTTTTTIASQRILQMIPSTIVPVTSPTDNSNVNEEEPSFSFYPSTSPSDSPSWSFYPSSAPSNTPSDEPSISIAPSATPSLSAAPSFSFYPSSAPSDTPTISAIPSLSPSDSPSDSPTFDDEEECICDPPPTEAPSINNNNNNGTEVIECKEGEESSFQLTFKFDGFPSDISWTLVGDERGNVLAGGSGYNDTLRGQKVVLDKVCMPTNGCYTFVIRDSQGDGLCCTMGGGKYNIDIDDGMDGFEGGIFSFRESMQFCVGETT